MTSGTDPAEIRLTGENSFIGLKESQDGPETARISFWRILYSPHGHGHVLFIKGSPQPNTDGVYHDNEPLARWIREEIERDCVPENPSFVSASFARSGDTGSTWIEQVEAQGTSIALSWGQLNAPFVLRTAVGDMPDDRPHGVYTVFFPARDASITVNGVKARGQAVPMDFFDRTGTTACLALSETWVR